MNKKLLEEIKVMFSTSSYPYKRIPEILKKLDIELMRLDLRAKHPELVRILDDKDLRGALYYSEDLEKYLILIHSEGQKKIETGFDLTLNERERFTVVHEIAHYLHHYSKLSKKNLKEGIVFYRDSIASQATDENEIFANGFAAECLLPESLVRNYLHLMAVDVIILPEDNATVVTMAKRFGVNPVVAKHRLKKLGLLKE